MINIPARALKQIKYCAQQMKYQEPVVSHENLFRHKDSGNSEMACFYVRVDMKFIIL